MKSIERPFYFGAPPELLKRADMLRKNMTGAEQLLCQRIKSKQINNLRFRAQHPIDRFIVDFFCPVVSLVIEIDGDIHTDKQVIERDEGREIELKKLGLKIIRFANEEVMNHINTVISKIVSECFSG